MAIEMKVPSVGESVTEVTIASWVKKDGDIVKMDEVICELESDKATFELPAESDGILRILAKEGETLPIGALICKIEPANGVQPAAAPKKEEAPAAPVVATAPQAVATKVVEVKVPAVGESITEVTIASWSKKDGDVVNMDEVICELESDKATFELPSPEAGVLKIVAPAGTTQPIGATVATITVGATASTPAPAAVAPQPEASASKVADTSYAAGHPSPVAAKILAEKGIEPSAVQGTGIGGRITKDDAVKAQAPAATPAAPVAEKKAEVAATPA
ncbi:MAG: E3 binding domain-containing protein, partial [Spirosomaceae bacterium]|nr:E3 binding domain-containing protein [Spirosomataceae bacterium]